MTARWLLAIDQGSHATRTIVFAGEGHEVVRAEAAVATRRPRDGWVEHEPHDVLASVRACLDAIAAALGADVRRISAAALATQRSSLVCWSLADGTPLSPVLSWQDVRGAGILESLSPDPAEVHAITGLRVSAHYGASKLRWCLDELPAVRAAADRGELGAAPLASWLLYALSGGGCFAVDPCNASRTLLWDLQTRDWSPRLLHLFGVPRAALPASRPNRSDWLTLRVGSHDVPLTVVTGDQSAVPFGFDGREDGTAFLTLGTGAFLQQVEGATPTACDGLLNSVIWQDGETLRHALEGSVNGAGAALAWLAERERIGEADLLAALPGWLSETREAPIFVNTIGGLASPFWKAGARSAFVGAGDRAGRAVAVVESIAFLVNANLESMRDCGRPARELIAVGGLARLDGLLARIASLAGVPVRRAAQPEATAYGAARLAAPSLPPLSLSASFSPDTALAAVLEPRYRACLERWHAL